MSNRNTMRKILSVSLPARVAEKIKNLSKQRGFDSVSGYIQHLIDIDEDLISADDLLTAAKEAKKEYSDGTLVSAKSMLDLL